MNTLKKGMTVTISILFMGLFIGGAILFFNQAATMPTGQSATSAPQAEEHTYISVSSLAFIPVNPATTYSLNETRQMLTLKDQSRNFTAERNIFVAPLSLPDQHVLTGLTVFGEDFDSQGAVQVRLKRCDHNQGRCTIVTEGASTNIFAIGRFESTKVGILTEVIDNNLHSYLLELELTALGNSGLRSVRLEFLDKEQIATIAGGLEQWELRGNNTRLPLVEGNLSQVRVCTNDLSALPNLTHYPFLLIDGQVTALASNSCVTVWGRSIEIRRALNTGASSGNYQILR